MQSGWLSQIFDTIHYCTPGTRSRCPVTVICLLYVILTLPEVFIYEYGFLDAVR